MIYNFHFGAKKPSRKNLIIVGIILSTTISILASYLRVNEENLWDLVDEVQRVLPNTIIRDIILLDPAKIERRVERDTDKAISDFKRLTGDNSDVIILPPRQTESEIDTSVCFSEDCQSLGGEFGLSSPWFEGS